MHKAASDCGVVDDEEDEEEEDEDKIAEASWKRDDCVRTEASCWETLAQSQESGGMGTEHDQVCELIAAEDEEDEDEEDEEDAEAGGGTHGGGHAISLNASSLNCWMS